jgi:c-di-GMP-binding flagellar brake protein YcgR
MAKIPEKRKYPRLKVYHLAKYRLFSEAKEGEPPIAASIRDIGGGGVCLRVEEQIPVASILQVYINFPHLPQSIPSLAKVVWVKKIGKSKRHELGIEFLEIEDIFRSAIIKRIESVNKKLNEKG